MLVRSMLSCTRAALGPDYKTVKLYPVRESEDDPEKNLFFRYTPSGELRLKVLPREPELEPTINDGSPPAGRGISVLEPVRFRAGADYYLDLEPLDHAGPEWPDPPEDAQMVLQVSAIEERVGRWVAGELEPGQLHVDFLGRGGSLRGHLVVDTIAEAVREVLEVGGWYAATFAEAG